MKTVNQFLKEMTEVFGKVEYRAEKDGQVFRSKGYKQIDGNWVTPATMPKMESKNGGKMSSMRSSKKTHK